MHSSLTLVDNHFHTYFMLTCTQAVLCHCLLQVLIWYYKIGYFWREFIFGCFVKLFFFESSNNKSQVYSHWSAWSHDHCMITWSLYDHTYILCTVILNWQLVSKPIGPHHSIWGTIDMHSPLHVQPSRSKMVDISDHEVIT